MRAAAARDIRPIEQYLLSHNDAGIVMSKIIIMPENTEAS